MVMSEHGTNIGVRSLLGEALTEFRNKNMRTSVIIYYRRRIYNERNNT